MAEVDLKEKVLPDAEALSAEDFAGQADRKVQLDIDDAPFLASPEENSLPAPTEEKLPDFSAEEQPSSKSGQKKWFLVAAVLLLLAAGGAGYWYFFLQPPPPVTAKVEPTVIVVPSPEEITGPAGFNVTFVPFMVEQRTGDTVHFLTTNFTAVTGDEAVSAEARSKMLVLRDAVYYYLRNKTHEYLVDPANSLTIKRDLTDILNGYLSKGKLDDVLLENYVVK